MVHVLLVLCRSKTSAILMPPGYFGEAAEGVPLHFNELFCYGSESSLQQCQYTYGPSTCSQHQQDLAVTCQGVDPVIIPNHGNYSSMSWIISWWIILLSQIEVDTWDSIFDKGTYTSAVLMKHFHVQSNYKKTVYCEFQIKTLMNWDSPPHIYYIDGIFQQHDYWYLKKHIWRQTYRE